MMTHFPNYLLRFAATAALATVTLIPGLARRSVAATEAPLKNRHENTNVILVSLQCLRPDHLGIYG